MAIECGAKNGIFPVDEITLEMISCSTVHLRYEADQDAEYERTIDIDLSQIKQTVAFPTSPKHSDLDDIPDIKSIRWSRSAQTEGSKIS